MRDVKDAVKVSNVDKSSGIDKPNKVVEDIRRGAHYERGLKFYGASYMDWKPEGMGDICDK